MEYIKSNKYDDKLIKEKIMGPNPLKLTEELLIAHNIPENALSRRKAALFREPRRLYLHSDTGHEKRLPRRAA